MSGGCVIGVNCSREIGPGVRGTGLVLSQVQVIDAARIVGDRFRFIGACVLLSVFGRSIYWTTGSVSPGRALQARTAKTGWMACVSICFGSLCEIAVGGACYLRMLRVR